MGIDWEYSASLLPPTDEYLVRFAGFLSEVSPRRRAKPVAQCLRESAGPVPHDRHGGWGSPQMMGV
jgi:hypothetical protein